MKSRLLIEIFVLCSLLVLSSACNKKADPVEPASTDRTTDTAYRQPLARGINLSNWFNDYSDRSQYSNRFTDAHFETLKSRGFTYVRIPIGQDVLFEKNNPSVLNPANLIHVEAAVQKAVSNGLAVTINYHTASDAFETTLPTSTVNQDKLAAYWKAMASHFRKYKTTEVFFEVYNEPHVASNGSLPASVNRQWWTAVQKKLIDAIRSETPDHFIIAGGEGWNSIDGLKLIFPYPVRNIIYNFHFYEPFFFTHQGATWTGPVMQKLRDLPYPSSPELVEPLLDTATDAEVIQYLTWYGDDNWNATRLEQVVAEAHNWAATNDAAIICNEFGSYKTYAPRQSRLDLIRDVRTILESHNIGWAMWEMDEGFGFIDYTLNDRTTFSVDDEVLNALGLN
jgi:endoglucanase